MQGETRRQTVMWAKVLVGVGAVFLVVGACLVVLLSLVPALTPGQNVTWGNGFLGGALCCFMPLALIGGILGVVGGVLWHSNREEPPTGLG
jgi:hypothetical protein